MARLFGRRMKLDASFHWRSRPINTIGGHIHCTAVRRLQCTLDRPLVVLSTTKKILGILEHLVSLANPLTRVYGYLTWDLKVRICSCSRSGDWWCTPRHVGAVAKWHEVNCHEHVTPRLGELVEVLKVCASDYSCLVQQCYISCHVGHSWHALEDTKKSHTRWRQDP